MKKVLLIISIIIFPVLSYGEDMVSTVESAFEKYSVGNYEEAAPMFEESYQMAKKNSPKDISGRFRTALYAALSYKGMGEYNKAVAWLQVCLALSEKVEGLYKKEILYSYIAECYRMLGDGVKSREYYQKSLKAENINDKDRAVIYYGLAESERLLNNYEVSKKYCEDALSYAGKTKIKKVESSCDIIKGEYYRKNKEYAKSMYHFGRAVDSARAMKDINVLIPALNGMALTSEALHKKDAAREYFEQSLFVAVENGLLDNVDILFKKILDNMPETANLKYQADKTKDLATLDFLDDETVLLLYKLSTLYYLADNKDFTELYTVSSEGYNMAEKLSRKDDILLFLYGMALALYETKEYDESLARVEEALNRKSNSDSKKLISKIYIVKSDSLFAQKEYEKAYSALEKAIDYADILEHKNLEKKLTAIKKYIKSE